MAIMRLTYADHKGDVTGIVWRCLTQVAGEGPTHVSSDAVVTCGRATRCANRHVCPRCSAVIRIRYHYGEAGRTEIGGDRANFEIRICRYRIGDDQTLRGRKTAIRKNDRVSQIGAGQLRT